jgi:hypothetical protein
MTREETIQRIKAHVTKARRYEEDIHEQTQTLKKKRDNHRNSAGVLLIELKKETTTGPEWAEVLREVGISQGYASKCMAIADGRKTDVQVRADNAKHNREYRQRKREEKYSHAPRENTEVSPDTDELEPVDLVDQALELVARMTLKQRAEFFDQLAAAYPHVAAYTAADGGTLPTRPETCRAAPAPDNGDPGDIPECLRRAA